jgi:hypothetical protein
MADMRHMRRQSQPVASPAEARLREYKSSGGGNSSVGVNRSASSGGDSTPGALGSLANGLSGAPRGGRSMMDMAPSFGATSSLELPKPSASYSYTPTANSPAPSPSILVGPGTAAATGVDRSSTAYKSMAMHAYTEQRQRGGLPSQQRAQNSARSARSGSTSPASSQTTESGSDDGGRRHRGANDSPRSEAGAPPSEPKSVSPKSVLSPQSAGRSAGGGAAKRGSGAGATQATRRFTVQAGGGASSDSDVGPTTSESEGEDGRLGGASPTERDTMVSQRRRNGSGGRPASGGGGVLAIADRSGSAGSGRRGAKTGLDASNRAKLARAQSLINATLYVAAKQPPWVRGEGGRSGEGEYSEDSGDSSSEDEREGKLGAECDACSSCRRTCTRCCQRLHSRPDPVQRELPPDREWERAEKALSASGAGIKKRCCNGYGRCSHKRCTLPVQLRLFAFGWKPTRDSTRWCVLGPLLATRAREGRGGGGVYTFMVAALVCAAISSSRSCWGGSCSWATPMLWRA